MNSRSLALIAALAGLAGLACQPAVQEAASGALTDADLATIREVAKQWAEHAKMGHADVVAGLYTEDAIELPPNAPALEGRTAIQARLEREFPGIKDLALTSVETDGRAGIAFDRGTYSVTVMEEGMTEPVTDAGKWMAVLRQQADGTWRLSRLIWNSDMPLPEGAPM